MKKRNLKDSLDGVEIPDTDVKDYWILNTNKNYVLRNLDKDDFKRKLDSLKIPVNIKLIDVHKY